MSRRERYGKLASKWLKGTITEAEKQEFSEWYNAHMDDQLELPTSFSDNEATLKNRILAKVKEAMANTDGVPKKQSLSPRIVAIAALLLLMVSIGIYLWNASRDRVVTDQLTLHNVQPGTNKATLLLADGRTIDLSSEQSGIVVGGEITYLDGSTVFSREFEDRSPETSEPESHLPTSDSRLLTLMTPNGGTYQITLPDGSKVWLNAASSLRYPATFSARAREVELLYGEAYFEVKPAKHPELIGQKVPFVVKTHNQQIEVLGTQFNVNAYENVKNRQMQTTLVEGAVRIHHPDHGNIELTPGQQAIYTANELIVADVDVEAYVAWKDGYFYFNEADIYTVLEQFARWYDISVHYELMNTEDLFVGKVPRAVSLSTALRVLKGAGVNFELKEGRQLYVKPRK